MTDFTCDILPGRVLVGGSRDQVSAEIDRLGCSRALVLSTPGHSDQAKDLAQKIGQLTAGVFSRAVMHTPVSVTEQAVKAASGECRLFGVLRGRVNDRSGKNHRLANRCAPNRASNALVALKYNGVGRFRHINVDLCRESLKSLG